jgi:hypothetical protein
MSASTVVVTGSVWHVGQYRPVSPQTAICFGPVLLFQFGVIIALSLFLAEVVRVTFAGPQKTSADSKITAKRAQIIGQWAFILFILLGCLISWFMYRDVYFP